MPPCRLCCFAQAPAFNAFLHSLGERYQDDAARDGFWKRLAAAGITVVDRAVPGPTCRASRYSRQFARRPWRRSLCQLLSAMAFCYRSMIGTCLRLLSCIGALHSEETTSLAASRRSFCCASPRAQLESDGLRTYWGR
jgi:hypothetical protein